MVHFDKYFLNPAKIERESDFDAFWQNSISELKSFPIESSINLNTAKGGSHFRIYNGTFKSYLKTSIHFELYVGLKVNRPRVIIVLPDYNTRNLYSKNKLDHSFAYMFLELRGHHILKKGQSPEEEEIRKEKSPGFMIEGIQDPASYYLKGVYLDAIRAIDFLRLNKEVDCSSIGIIGKGLGAAAAVFCSAFSERVSSLVVDSPTFTNLTIFQNISQSDEANEINEFLDDNKPKKKLIKKNLSYFDTISFSDMIKCPVLMATGLKDLKSPPECALSLFNNLLCDKTIEIYPEEGNTAGGSTQFLKSLKFMKDKLDD